MKAVLTAIGAFISVIALVFILKGIGLVSYQFWGVKYENAHREIFEESKSFNHGMIRDLENLCLEYNRLESRTHKDALGATIQHRRSAFKGQLPNHVQDCINSL